MASSRPARSEAADAPGGAPDAPTHELAELRRAEHIIIRLRWIAMAAWPAIFLTIEPPLGWLYPWAAWGVAMLYVLATHELNRRGRAVRATALATTAIDPGVTALACAVTGGIESALYPFFYLTTLATSIRFGMTATFATVGLTALLSAALFTLAPGSSATLADLAIRVFFLLFVGLEGGLLSREAREHSRRRREMLARLIHVEEEERRRLAGEIHDRLGRRLFGFYQELDRRRANLAPRDPETAAALERLSGEARGCADEIRDLSNALRPVVLDDFGFVEALREHVAALEARGEIAVGLHVDPAVPPRPAAGIVLFRVLQEALANVQRHAGASRVDVDLAATGGMLRLAIRDDGRGFAPRSPARERGHFGLLYMRERVESAGGTLEVHARPGSGTEIRVTVPARDQR